MKIATLIARVLLGLVFVVFGMNMFLKFIPMPPPPAGSPAANFFGSMYQTGYIQFVHVLEVVGGLLLLSGRFVPLALILLGAITFNIVTFHALMAPSGLPMGIILTALAAFLVYSYRAAFAGLARP